MKYLPVAMVVGLLIAAQPPIDKLDGTWAATAVEAHGNKVPEEQAKAYKLFFEGDKLSVQVADGSKRNGTYKTNASMKPATIDITLTDGPEKGMLQKGIYSLEGDTLKIALGEKGARPTEFATKAGDDVVVVICKREKK
jgi:uncharacterized protein (TIGR03067 family)